MARWTRFILRNRISVLALWLLIFILGILSSSNLNSHLTTSLAIPHSPSAQTDALLTQHFNENIEGTFTVIFPFKNATNSQISTFEDQISSASSIVPTASIAEVKALGGILLVNINTSLSLAKAAHYTPLLRAEIRKSGLVGALVTGPPAIESDVTPVLSSDLHRGEIFGLSIALLLLILILGFSLQVLIPFIFAAASISATISLVFLISERSLVVLYTPNIVELIGLGLAIDYSLLLLFRFRKEFDGESVDRDEAILRTMASAGRTIAISSATVALALSTLIFVPVPFIRSLGIATALVPLISLAVTFSLLPVLLSFLSNSRQIRKSSTKPFASLATFIVQRPLVVAISSIAILMALSSSALALDLTPSSLTAIPDQLESQQALNIVSSKVGSGVITPDQLVIDLGAPNLASTPTIVAARNNLSTQLLKKPDIFVVATGKKTPYVDKTGRYLRLFVFPKESFGSSQAQNLVKQLRDIALTKYGFPPTATLYVGGAAAQGADLIRELSRSFPWIVLFALLATFVLLCGAFKSVVIPIKAIVLDLISLSVAYGIVVLAFGNSAIAKFLGIYHLNQIEAWAALFLFVLLFGISMDYEVFIISRIKEAKDAGLSNSEAISEGVTQTGIVVTTAALIFIGAVCGLALGHFAGLQEIGIGLAFGVFVDATIVRGLLLPSVMVLLGRWNWWTPEFMRGQNKTSPTPLLEERG